MRFGRVEGVLTPAERDGAPALRLTVHLETGSRLSVVRDEVVGPPPVFPGADDWWYVDQLTQETIGNELATAGWEVVAAGEPPADDPEPGALVRSPAYVVRNLG